MPRQIANPTELRLLALLQANKGLTGRQVAAAHKDALPKETLSQASAYTSLRRMVDKGWVKAAPTAGDDGRLRVFRATAKGAKLLAASRAFYVDLAGFEPDAMPEDS